MKIASPLTTEPTPILQWIEVASSLSIPNFHIIGLAAPEVAEARERVRAAIEAQDFEFPRKRVVVNLSPASIRKRGTGSDLAMALGILASNTEERLPPGSVVASGELGLDGRVKSVGQVMRTLYASCQSGVRLILLSEEDHCLAVPFLELLKQTGEFNSRFPSLAAVSDLRHAWEALLGREARGRKDERDEMDGTEVMAQISARAIPGAGDAPLPSIEDTLLSLEVHLEKLISIAAAGRHHLLLLGPRGAGKSQALEWFSRLQPPASPRTRVHHQLLRELMQLHESQIPLEVPVRRVGAQVRPQALTGGATPSSVKPGEFSLAHGGILLADELPEWSRDSREAFREPLERGSITITRTHASTELPAEFTLVANGNLCPCGGWPKSLPPGIHPASTACRRDSPCVCALPVVQKYLERLSGPILDRIDLIALVAPVSFTKTAPSRDFREIKERIQRAHDLAVELWGAPAGTLSAPRVERLLSENPDWRVALDPLKLTSFRSRHKAIRIALTLAIWDHLQGLSDSPRPRAHHFEEASYYRPEVLNLFQRLGAPKAPSP